MDKITLNVTEDNGVLVGELTRQTVMQISKKSIKQIITQQSLVIDLQQVTRIDTAGLAWLFYLLEQANSSRCQLSFSNIPTKLKNLISLSGVEGFLPLANKS
ncbi:STAS domain-containing protein [Colwellia sp. 4_MG-2023]|uniref:STAS domain-containing protein n=1 Tax=unclassified Colwellia TaxID=196834 RepID=UPI0026E422AB|nr:MULTISPECIES: STAS domain-containing protein [unclassified Colwellia]MDO6486428.1 STAS domain-containing protein [Colwellia sp. 6_MG-2023]MDO6506306.1 STAS domain-containing protein [Colwellia sp. 5_MG-2023]MDO6555130.1 STAS domain-containing protein [Colwellia sp. 4_MG-2023]MDO6651684.1 STAS domain-containing protein [Colwellia sp. 3_MG-2023]MDO6664918.1 STAS domain-containing protein [Colwellia sp. 2_MG-2023]